MGSCLSKPQTQTTTTASTAQPAATPAATTTTTTAPPAAVPAEVPANTTVSQSTVPLATQPATTTTTTMSNTAASKGVAIIIYSMYGHIAAMAEAVKKGVEASGVSATIYQVSETLPQEVLDKMHAPAKKDYPTATSDTLVQHDAYLFGVPTRYGNMPGQFKAFWDATGGLWASGALSGKIAGTFVSTSSLGGGQETTALQQLSTFTHHGIIFVPLGYANTFAQATNLNEVHGGSAWGAGTVTAGDGSRMPSPLELEMAEIQGREFAATAKRFTKA
ncbi:flavodoxin-like fold protein [Savitreella phatthalungensis]